MPVAVLDLDGTLYPGTAGFPLMRALADAGHCAPDDISALFTYMDGLSADVLNTSGPATQAYQLFARATANADPVAVAELSRAVWQRERLTLFPFARPLVEALHEVRYTVILISGSPHDIVQAAADDLGIEHCQGAVFQDGRVVTAPGVPGAKERLLPADAELAIAIGNSGADSGLLARATWPIAFEPLPVFRRTAETNGWMIADRDTVMSVVRTILPAPLPGITETS